MRPLACVALAALAGCVGSPAQVSWTPEPYSGFLASVDALAGPSAIDCGFVRLAHARGGREHRAAFRCVSDSVERGVPFKYGTLRIPIDSFAYEALVRSPDGRFHLIVYDRMILDDFAQEWRRVCERVSLDARHVTYDGLSCESAPESR